MSDLEIEGYEKPYDDEPDNQSVKFVWRFDYDEKASLEAGRPMYKPNVYVHVVSEEGEVRDIKFIRANDMHKKKFRSAWARFKKFVAPEIDIGIYDPLPPDVLKQSYPESYEAYISALAKEGHEGTLLSAWNQMPLDMALELKYQGIFTIEDMLESEGLAPDALKLAAEQYINAAKEPSYLNRLADRVVKLTEKIRELETTNEILRKKLREI